MECFDDYTDAVARDNAFYGQGSGAINLDDVACTGDESRLIDCPFPPIHNCGHSEDAGVDCSTVCKCKLLPCALQLTYTCT